MSILYEIESINKVKSDLLVKQQILLQKKRYIIANYLEGKMADFKEIRPIYIKRERIYPHKEIYFEEQYFTRVKCKDNILYFFSNKNIDFNSNTDIQTIDQFNKLMELMDIDFKLKDI